MTTPNPENAPPGTEVVCVDASDRAHPGYRPKIGFPFKNGEVVTVGRWYPHPAGYQTVLIEECAAWVAFMPTRFRLLHRAASPSYYETQRELEDA
jgi:hypothetical protein